MFRMVGKQILCMLSVVVASCPCWEELPRKSVGRSETADGLQKRTSSTAHASAREWREVEVP